MSIRITHSLLLAFLLALSGHMVHTVLVHDEGVCEICLHIQSTDDSDQPTEPHYTHLWDATLPSLPITDQPKFDQSVWIELNPRGPPAFSFVI